MKISKSQAYDLSVKHDFGGDFMRVSVNHAMKRVLIWLQNGEEPSNLDAVAANHGYKKVILRSGAKDLCDTTSLLLKNNKNLGEN